MPAEKNLANFECAEPVYPCWRQRREKCVNQIKQFWGRLRLRPDCPCGRTVQRMIWLLSVRAPARFGRMSGFS